MVLPEGRAIGGQGRVGGGEHTHHKGAGGNGWDDGKFHSGYYSSGFHSASIP